MISLCLASPRTSLRRQWVPNFVLSSLCFAVSLCWAFFVAIVVKISYRQAATGCSHCSCSNILFGSLDAYVVLNLSIN